MQQDVGCGSRAHKGQHMLFACCAVLTAVSAHACRCHGIEHSYQPGKGENTFYAFSTDPAGVQTPAYNFQDSVDSW
jgi:hypothetical protein